MNIYVLDPEDISILAVVNSYSARNWNKVWSESGSFTLWVPITEENKEFLVRENLIWPDDQDCVGVIERVHNYTSEEGTPLMEVSGRFSEQAYLFRRIIWGNARISDYPANIIKFLIQNQAVDCLDTDRQLGPGINPIVSILPGTPLQEEIDYCNSYGNLWEEVKGLSIEYNLHVEFRYAQDLLNAVIFSSVDRSDTVILSTDLGFLTNSDYLCDSTDYCNTALIAGEGEGAEREKAYILSQETQRNRRELYVDARDLQKNSSSSEDPMTEEEYISVLVQRGQKKLLEYPLCESYECSLQVTGEEGYVFGEDYNLGDTVTLIDNILGVQVQAQVKEHQIDEDKDGRTDTLVFGISIPTITSIVKRRS